MSSVLEQPTLVLNSGWIAIDVKSVRHAVDKVCSGNAVIVDHDYQQYTWNQWGMLLPGPNEPVIRTGSGPVRVPDVIVTVNYERVHSRTVVFNRRNLFARDRNVCQYCGKHFPSSECTIDHVIPQCQGGRSEWINCVLACVDCNVRKGGRTPRQANMRLIRTPVRPTWSPMFRTRQIKPVWGKFIENFDKIISELYWQVELVK